MSILRFRSDAILAGAGALVACCAAGQPAQGQFQEPEGQALFTFSDPDPAFYGWAVAEMVDIDGDGVKEAIIGSQFPQIEVRSGATGALIHEFEAPGLLGFAVADAGDVDGDGVNDIGGGAPAASQALVFSGATGETLMTLTAPNTTNLGTSIASAGDINADGHADILVGDRAFNVPNSPDGRVFVFSGADGSILREYPAPAAAALFGGGAALTGDVDGDGLGEHIIGASLISKAFVYSGGTGELLFEFTGPPSAAGFGLFFVDGLNDVDGDHVPDFYVGDFGDNPEGLTTPPFPGAAYVYSGADGSLIHQFNGGGDLTGLGPGRGAGDVDFDGREDLIIGAFNASTGVPNGGQVNIYAGCDGSLIRSFTSAVENEQLGFDCVGLGDVNDDRYPDFLLSAANGNTVYIGVGDQRCAADVNGDGVVDFKDLRFVARAVRTNDPAADITCDGTVDGRDLILVIVSLKIC